MPDAAGPVGGGRNLRRIPGVAGLSAGTVQPPADRRPQSTAGAAARVASVPAGHPGKRPNVIQNGPAAEAVQEITRRLVGATTNRDFLRATGQAEPPRYDWKVRLIRSKEVNAFCLPGGKMVVYTGIMPVAQTHAGLATVMGHEISHALCHHGAERMAQERIIQVLAGGAGLLSDMDPQRQQR